MESNGFLNVSEGHVTSNTIWNSWCLSWIKTILQGLPGLPPCQLVLMKNGLLDYQDDWITEVWVKTTILTSR